MSEVADAALLYAVRPAVLAQRAGQLALLLAALTVAPFAVSLAAGESVAAWRYGCVLATLALVGFWLARRAAPSSIQANEALVISALAFTLTPLAMTYPVMASGLSFVDALFECVSGVTTTGLSTLGTLGGKPLSFLFERAWMQWFGGLGIVVLSVALMFGYDSAAHRLVESPVSPQTLDTSTRLHARRSFVTYAVLTLLAMVVLWLAGWPVFAAVVLALSAISTGGFAPQDASLGAASLWSSRAAVLGVAFLGAVALPLYRDVWHRKWRAVAADVELRLLVASCVIATALLMLLSARAHGGWSAALAGHAAAMAVSAQTTSGFATLPVEKLDRASQLVLIVSMAVGGSVGSTAGGIKLLRLLLLLRIAQIIVRRTAMPSRAVAVPRVMGTPVTVGDMSAALFVVLLSVATVVASWLPFLAYGYDPFPALFEVVSAVGTVGLSAGVVGPGLPDVLKGVLCVDMLMGRLEFVALLVVVYPRTWFGRRLT